MKPLHPITITAIVITLAAIVAFIVIGASVMRSQKKNANYKRGKTVKEFQFFFAAVGMVIFTFLIHNYDIIYQHDYKIAFTVLAITAIRTAWRYYKDMPVFKAKIISYQEVNTIADDLLQNPNLSEATKNEIKERVKELQ
ncbi:hypothetical protein ACFSYG_11880 [Leeuwenhoekiella polynyae]|uniref:Uncharacterized protein n=1 Tax=Leeuwenhoekiella polynyae TaxID=1550906 RepID=A0A4Q0PFM8_9FLAO|nr:hypothetical protein [Leeuwenhoekiella polynyae]RXG25705.1 hypothetical protein DSM02_872 [Leeuwenhoekiella polynyae]